MLKYFSLKVTFQIACFRKEFFFVDLAKILISTNARGKSLEKNLVHFSNKSPKKQFVGVYF